MKDTLQKLEKPAHRSKKFGAYLISILLLSGLTGLSIYRGSDAWAIRVGMGAVALVSAVSVLGIAKLERVILRVGALRDPTVDDALDRIPILPQADPPPPLERDKGARIV